MKGQASSAAVVIGASLVLAAVAFALVGELLRGAGDTGDRGGARAARARAATAQAARHRRRWRATSPSCSRDSDGAATSGWRRPPRRRRRRAGDRRRCPPDQFGGDARRCPSTEGLVDPMQLAKGRFNRGIVRPTPPVLRELLGEPRASYSDQTASR